MEEVGRYLEKLGNTLGKLEQTRIELQEQHAADLEVDYGSSHVFSKERTHD